MNVYTFQDDPIGEALREQQFRAHYLYACARREYEHWARVFANVAPGGCIFVPEHARGFGPDCGYVIETQRLAASASAEARRIMGIEQ